MLASFPGFTRPTDDEFKKLWKDCLFVLDTNVILNLYRYPPETTDELINILKKLRGRIWIPFHVALEFHRNRHSVIADEMSKYRKLRETVVSIKQDLKTKLDNLHSRYATLNPDQILLSVNPVFDQYVDQISNLQDHQPNLHHTDNILDEITAILGANIGVPPESQAELDALYKDGERRYQIRVPPGYMDRDKEKSSSEKTEEYSYGGITYKPEYGDLLVWNQILAYARNEKIKSLVFLTDDEKEDWWWIIESGGKKTVGPRPELVREIRGAGVDLFYMYSTERFLEFAKPNLGIEVDKKTVDKVRDTVLETMAENAQRLNSYLGIPNSDLATSQLRAIALWLNSQFVADTISTSSDAPFVIYRTRVDGKSFIYGVILINELSSLTTLGQQINSRLAELQALVPPSTERIILVAYEIPMSLPEFMGLIPAMNIPRELQLIIGALRIVISNRGPTYQFFTL